ncbi:hypothetical protein [Paraliomyxa miuraensis]|uniref:hypothetical protein n=1 Tax=Paraliomyxa miuraensis TaxID=376150 RepID=UPI00225044AD|nr:hypothetical protein [Paraliomyxa miuraensis]MCX4244996.1 hypothetical protein [Paraliomyxa miuraensis]
MSFGQFYQDGGVFMHVITLLTLFVGGMLVRRIRTIRRTFRDPKEQLGRLRRGDVLTPSLVAAMVMTGLLGTGLGWIDLNMALQTVPSEHWAMAQSLGGRIASYPLVWSLVCAIPLTLGHGTMRYFEERLRALIEKHA